MDAPSHAILDDMRRRRAASAARRRERVARLKVTATVGVFAAVWVAGVVASGLIFAALVKLAWLFLFG